MTSTQGNFRVATPAAFLTIANVTGILSINSFEIHHQFPLVYLHHIKGTL